MSGQAGRDRGETPGDQNVDPGDTREQREESSDLQAEAATELDSDAADEGVDLRAKADENWELYVRTAAELENVRKRAARDVENARKFAIERFARDLLEVRDSLEMGIDAAGDAGGTLLEGSKATLKLLVNTLQQFGVTELDPLGQPFDPEEHEAMAMQPSAEVEPGSVMTVFQKGYTLNGRLLRAARVVVAEAPPVEGG